MIALLVKLGETERIMARKPGPGHQPAPTYGPIPANAPRPKSAAKGMVNPASDHGPMSHARPAPPAPLSKINPPGMRLRTQGPGPINQGTRNPSGKAIDPFFNVVPGGNFIPSISPRTETPAAAPSLIEQLDAYYKGGGVGPVGVPWHP